jgi:hypothetical protein
LTHHNKQQDNTQKEATAATQLRQTTHIVLDIVFGAGIQQQLHAVRAT